MTQGVSQNDLAILKEIAAELQVPLTMWNLSKDPCVDRWTGIGCCSGQSSYCCKSPSDMYFNLPISLNCDYNSDANVTVLMLRSDFTSTVLNGTIGRMSSLCKLTSLLCLDVEGNNLDGEIPACLDDLQTLKVLRLGRNRISGDIPAQLGNLKSLEDLYLQSLSLTGNIPSSLTRLTSLIRVHLQNNRLEGSIPVELTSIPRLSWVELHGNRLTGGIPAFGKEIQTLKAYGNLLSGELNATAINNMLACSYLDLRDNLFNWSIPNISLPELLILDLSFNRFSGGIPGLQTDKLQSLFLGHNYLTGDALLEQLPSSLQVLDVSHNQLSTLGNQSSSEKQVNYAFNSGFEFPTTGNGGSKHLFFAVNSGGSNIFVHGNMTYDEDTSTASADESSNSNSNSSVGLFHIPGRAWALELSGMTAGTYALDQSEVIQSNSTDSIDVELYRSMRWSSSYVAYHGTGLQPGTYTVTLHFAELVFGKPEERVFDVYVAGIMVKQGLDVVKETGGSRRAYKIMTEATISDNGTLSVMLIYASGKDGPTNGGPMISAVSVVSPDYRNDKPGSNKNQAGVVVGSVVGAAAAMLFIISAWFWWRRRTRTKARMDHSRSTQKSSSQREMSPGNFTYDQLYNATNGFTTKLGEGGFGAVFKGTLPDGIHIAVKQLIVDSSVEDFHREIYILHKIRHPNLVPVLGHSFHGSKAPMLVTEFMPNGSLDKWLFPRSNQPLLTWEQRVRIAIGVASGLAYLHEESTYKIFHLDIKPGNILLDSDMAPRIADFGLSKLFGEEDGRSQSRYAASTVRGTMGYLAPEYATQRVLSDKVDVYSFGVVLLELLSGRKAINLESSTEILLVDWAHREIAESSVEAVLDKKLNGDFDKEEAKDMAAVAVLCTHLKPVMRPKMQAVWLMLNGDVKVSDFLIGGFRLSVL